jgi:hypothetical protein
MSAQPLSLQMKCLLISPFTQRKSGRDLVKVLAPLCVVDVRWQFVSYSGGNHAMSPPR